MNSKVKRATEFIQRLKTMDPSQARAVILREAGEDLCRFFIQVGVGIWRMCPPQEQEEMAATLIMYGYLVRANEPSAHDVTVAQA